jgi:allantoin racemase
MTDAVHTSAAVPRPIGVVLAQYPDDERERRENAVRAAAPYGVDVRFFEVQGSVYKKGLTDYHRSMVAPLVAKAAMQAQDAGCGAVVPYGTLDLGIEESRHVVDIPVLGPGRTGSHVAGMVARRVAVLCYDQAHVVMFRKLLPSWGAVEPITSIRAVHVPITEMAARLDDLRRRFLEEARDAIESEGAEVILPLGMTMVPVLLGAADLAQELGVPVLDPLALTLHVASGLAAGNFNNSRVAYPKAELT